MRVFLVSTFLVILVFAIGAPATAGTNELQGADRVAVAAAQRAYVEAWRANDPDAVMATLTDDAVLIPHLGDDPVRGAEAIRGFWFPADGPASEVIHFVSSVEEIRVGGDLAVVWRRFELAFSVDGTTYRNAGNYLSVLVRDEAGAWRIGRHIWNDPVPEQD